MQRYFGIKKINNIIYLNIEDFNHIKNVMRKKADDKVFVVYDEVSYICSLNNDLMSATIVEQINNNNSLNVLLYIPILKEEKIDLIIQKSTELGVKKIIPVEMQRCKFKINIDKKEKKISRWKRIAKEASEQSHRNDIPLIEDIVKIEDIVSSDVNIVCSTDKESVKNINKVLNGVNNSDIISVVFGPEGGFTDKEENLLLDKGFTKTTLGSRILRTETVPLYILSIINYIFME